MIAIDIKECEKCKGPVKIIACIEDPVVIEKIQVHLKANEFDRQSPNKLLPNRAPPELPGLNQGLID